MMWLLLGGVVIGIGLLHELGHVLVARLFGYRPLAWGPVVGGGFVLFDDTFEPEWPRLYWSLQLVVPWLVTAALLPAAWMSGFRAGGLPWEEAARVATGPMFVLLSLLVSAAGSLGDLALALAMPRLASREPDLTLRDMRLHQRFGARPIFTRHGREVLLRRYGEPAGEVWQRARELPPTSLRVLLQRGK